MQTELCSDETQEKAMSRELGWRAGFGGQENPCLNQESTLPSWGTLNLLLNHPKLHFPYLQHGVKIMPLRKTVTVGLNEVAMP